jgi:hypothetical protein
MNYYSKMMSWYSHPFFKLSQLYFGSVDLIFVCVDNVWKGVADVLEEWLPFIFSANHDDAASKSPPTFSHSANT